MGETEDFGGGSLRVGVIGVGVMGSNHARVLAELPRVKLVGVADPLAQEGGGAVTSVTARLTGQTVEPAPKPGFAGAAAVDAQGRFAGMVELNSPVVAGNGPATAQATLVPADTVRAFLTSHGVTPVSGHGAMDQSVLRIICVRK